MPVRFAVSSRVDRGSHGASNFRPNELKIGQTGPEELSVTESSGLVQPKIICPHCWHNFYADHAYYISRHPELHGDVVLPQENRRFAPGEVQRGRDGIVRDQKGWEILERACPVCHLQIPAELLIRSPFFVSVVGAPRSGKTYFLASMIHWLRKELAQDFGYSLHDSDSHEVRAFQEYEGRLFYTANPADLTYLDKTQEYGALYNRPIIDGVEVTLPKPFIFTFRPTETNPDQTSVVKRNCMVLYDNAGESFEPQQDQKANTRVTHHLAESDAVLFAFDPLQDSSVRSKLLAASNDPQLNKAAVSHRQETILKEIVNRIRRYTGRTGPKKLKPLLAVCVQKYDVWKSLLPYARVETGDGDRRWSIDHTSVEFSNRHGIAGLDIEEINRISLLVRNFVNEINPQFVAAAEAEFKEVRYFPLSALGVSPEYNDASELKHQLMVRPSDMQPFRVTHPMLWLLKRWGLIRACRWTNNDSQKFPHLVLREIKDDKMRLAHPQTNRLITLDLEYAGGTIIDPTSGEILWVPPLPDAGPVGKSQTTSPTKTDAPAYKLPAAPQKPKKGWFRK